MVVVYVFAALALLRFLIIGVAVALIVKPVPHCPACFQETVKIRRVWLARLSPWLEWRWCATCGWEGPARKVEDARPEIVSRGSTPVRIPRSG